MNIISSLIEIRKSKKVSQKEMAEMIGVTPTTLNRYELGKRVMPYALLKGYATNLGYNLSMILWNGEDWKNSK